MTYYEILEGEDKGKILRVDHGIGEIKNDSKWEPYNALDVLFGKIDSRTLSEIEITKER